LLFIFDILFDICYLISYLARISRRALHLCRAAYALHALLATAAPARATCALRICCAQNTSRALFAARRIFSPAWRAITSSPRCTLTHNALAQALRSLHRALRGSARRWRASHQLLRAAAAHRARCC